MEIRIITEPEYRNSFWCTETLKGIYNQAYLKKIRLIEVQESDLNQRKEHPAKKVVTIIGTSINWINRISAFVQERGYLCLLVTGDQDTSSVNRTNSLLLDYQGSMHALLSHLKNRGDQKVALFGVNPSSYADTIKKNCFPQKKDIYYNYGSIVTSTNQIWSRIDNYTAVICVNDTVAIHLLRFLLEKGVRIPENLRLISFGDSFLSRLMSPSITSVEQDFRMLGAQAVQVCSFLEKNPQLVINAFIKCPLRIRESTYVENIIPPKNIWEPESPDINFYHDESIATIQALDRLLVESDDLDIQILKCLLNGSTQEKTAETLNLSLSSLRYRIRKLRSHFPDSPKDAMLATIRKYLSYDALEQALLIKRQEHQNAGIS